jgi:hypothetical protein
MKIELFKAKQKWRKGGFHTNPNVGWGLILVVSLLLILAALTFGGLLFLETRADYVPEESGNGGQIRIVKKARILQALEYFEEREERSREILIDGAPVVDPSL